VLATEDVKQAVILTEVLDGQRSVYSAELTLAEARVNEYRNLVQLYKALGGGGISKHIRLECNAYLCRKQRFRRTLGPYAIIRPEVASRVEVAMTTAD